ncbi:MAG: tetratricopeptide repeat protein [Terriglobia bacterium]
MGHRTSLISLLLVVTFSTAWLGFSTGSRPLPEAPEYRQAESLIREGQWDEGLQILDGLLRSDPRDLKALNLMGIALTGKGRAQQANQTFRRALKINPAFYPALKNLAVNEASLNEISAAERDFTGALKFAPNDPVIHTYLGEIAFRRHDYQGAVFHLAKVGAALEQAPPAALDLADAHFRTNHPRKGVEGLAAIKPQGLDPTQQFRAGYLLAQHGHCQEAIPFFRGVRERFPDSFDTSFDLGVCYIRTKQYQQAIALLSGTHSRGDEGAQLDNLLAEAYEDNKQTQEAIDVLRQATVLAPKDENNYLDLANLCIDHNNYPLGIQVVNVGLRYRPNSERLTFQRGVLLALSDSFDLAVKDFQVAADLGPDSDLPYVGIGLVYLQQGKLKKTVEVLRARIRRQPNDYVMQYLLGEALIRSGVTLLAPSFNVALGALEKAVKLNPNFFRAQIDLAKIYLMARRVDDAIIHLEKARALAPKERAVYAQLANAYRQKGALPKAEAMMEKVAQLNNYEREHDYRDMVRIVAGRPPEASTRQALHPALNAPP